MTTTPALPGKSAHTHGVRYRTLASHMCRIFVCLALFGAALGLTGPLKALAAPVTATITEVQGEVFVINEDGERGPAHIDQSLGQGQQLETGPDSKAVLTLSDGSRLSVFEDSLIEMNEVLPDEETSGSVSVFFGRLSLFAHGLRGDDVVITPTLTCGIRGTEFTVVVADDGSSAVVVDDGMVRVTTDDQADETAAEADVEAGHQVVAERPGAALQPEPIIMRTFEDYRKFKAQRSERFVEKLPEIIARLEQSIDKSVDRLEWMAAQPMNRAKILAKLKERLDKLGPGQGAERAKIIMQVHMEAAKAQGFAQRYRRQRMRLKSVFSRTERLKQLLPRYKEMLGENYTETDEILTRIMDRKQEVMEKERMAFNRFKESLKPLRAKYDEMQDDKDDK